MQIQSVSIQKEALKQYFPLVINVRSGSNVCVWDDIVNYSMQMRGAKR